jgi:dGTP triphosphohydrolase
MTSSFIGRYITATTLRVPTTGQTFLDIPEAIQSEVAILKQITRRYVITTPALLGQQRGQERLLTELFEDLYPVGAEKYLPRRFEYLLHGDHSRARRVADCISGLTEAETVGLHRRLRGHESGSVLDPIVR